MGGRRIAAVGASALVALVFAAALTARFWHLGTAPGLNGDEAWHGVQAARLLAGDATAWRTGSRAHFGLPPNPLITASDALLLAVASPRLWLLRVPSAVAGALAVLLALALGRRALDQTTAVLAALLLAVLPIAIGYSRFGWDPSLTPLFGVVTVCAALRGQVLLAGLAFAGGLIVHPTNLFLFPALALPGAVAFGRRMAGRPVLRALGFAALGLLTVAIVTVVALRSPNFGREVALARLHLGPLSRYALNFGRLLSGVTLYEYVIGPVAPAVAQRHDLVFWLAVALGLDFGVRRLVRRRQWDRLALVVGVPLAALGHHVVAGPDAIAPHFERYGLFLVAPAVFAAAALVRSLLPEEAAVRFPAARRWGLAAAAVLAGLWLAGFERQYFAPLRRSGGDSHRTFRTARSEPKQQAFDGVCAEVGQAGLPGAPVRIVAEDWWLHQPLEFLATARPGWTVANAEAAGADPAVRRARWEAELAAGAFLVGFAGGPLETEARAASGRTLRRTVIADRAGRPLVVVLRDPGAVLAHGGREGTARR